MFDYPAYIVLELPESIARKIRVIRSWFDSRRSELPVEITLSGSCGAGTIAGDEMLEHVRGVMSRAAAFFKPFETSFSMTGRFSGTDIFYFAPELKDPFVKIHKYFMDSGIKFNPVRYKEYNPHCTIKLRGETSSQEVADLMKISVPDEKFVIETLSLYSLRTETEPTLLHSEKLHGTN